MLCPRCQSPTTISEDDQQGDWLQVTCHNCGFESAIHNNQMNNSILNPPVFENGVLIVVINKEHVWYNQIGLVCGTKHLHTRIEVLGHTVWVPSTWIKALDESHGTNE